MDNKYIKKDLSIPKNDKIIKQLQAGLQTVDDILFKNYIDNLKQYEIVPLNKSLIGKNIEDKVRLFKITEMVYEKNEFSMQKFSTVFNALTNLNCSVFLIIDSNGVKTDFYMGVHIMDDDRSIASIEKTLKGSLVGQFPGIKTQIYRNNDTLKLIKGFKADNISVVSCVANIKDEEEYHHKSFVQGLEKFVLALQGQKYTGIILANASDQKQIIKLRDMYEHLYSQLVPLAKTQINYGSNSSLNKSIGVSVADSIGETQTTGTSQTKGITKTTSHTDSISESKGKTDSLNVSVGAFGSISQATGGLLSGLGNASGMLGMALAPFTGGASMAIGGAIGAGLGAIGAMSPALSGGLSLGVSGGRSWTTTNTTGYSDTSSFSENESYTKSSSISKTNTKTVTNTNSDGIAQGNSQNMTINIENKKISNLLERIDNQIERLKDFESFGMWECAAYFLSESSYTTEIAASTYKSLMSGENSGIENSAINNWQGMLSKDKQSISLLKDYILNMMHPVFRYDNGFNNNMTVTPCSFISSKELAIHMGLPRKSVCGFPVIEHASFAKEVVNYNHEEFTKILNLGKIYNMGSEQDNLVKLNKESLTMHTFVTGATGSGKSNTIYEILDQLKNTGIKFLVIEPAKGEYKHIFGYEKNVKVLGTNLLYTDILKINPFKFPKGIHILEHIDGLIEIFNVCWPMYAAMPAVLKESILEAYEDCGWDLELSINKFNEDLYPTFKDLLSSLIHVIDKSSYDNEVKSNYKGSLETRIKSLTNGLNGQIFSYDEINNKQLFDENVIVDLSRVNSVETKSLIMGLLIMRLNEYRSVNATEMNSSLRHVTVLEEAHNILKRTSTEQGLESANLVGKSVEMITNAIAEMRTYGEGFIIADQSPNSVDMAAIRNTNMKIIMRLPDEEDRRLAGKAAALNENQLEEIAKLPKGVAVVYQNDWLEPVLCKINKADVKEKRYERNFDINKIRVINNNVQRTLIRCLLSKCTNMKVEYFWENIKADVLKTNCMTKTKLKIIEILSTSSKFNLEEIAPIIADLFDTKNLLNFAVDEKSIESWNRKLIDKLELNNLGLNKREINYVLQCILLNESINIPELKTMYIKWKSYMEKNI